MARMKLRFYGLGSIAGRHIRNLRELYGNELEICVVRSGHGAEIEHDLKEKIDIVQTRDTNEWCDSIFITNPTFLHYETLRHHIDDSDAFFVEKPVFLTGEEDIASFVNKEKLFYVACPLRYTGVVRYLKDNIDFSSVYSIRCISSSYLPDWREKDYTKTYSAHKSQGGGVSVDLIHEWDYLIHLIGYPISVKSIISKKSELDLDADDLALYIAEYSNMLVELHLDYFGRIPQRRIELYTKDDVITADLISARIDWKKSGKSITFDENRDDYHKRELMHFFDLIDKRQKSDHSLEEGCKTLKLARGGL